MSEESNKVKKPRKRKHPPINVYHVIKFADEAKNDAHQFNMMMNEKYNYTFTLAQLRLYIKNLNTKTLIPMGVKPIQLTSNRSAANAEYTVNAVMEMIAAGKLQMANADAPAPKKPTKATK